MSQKYPGGLITKSPITPSGPYETSTASGIWTLDQQAYWQKLGQWPTAGRGTPDPQFNYVTMLLHGDGTNGAQNNTFLDSSTNNFTLTRNGNTTQGSFSPYGTDWSNFFENSTNGNYLSWDFPSSPVQNAVAGTNYTIEFWVFRQPRTNTYQSIFSCENDRNNFTMSGTDLQLTSNGGTVIFTVTANTYIPVNTWTHVALVCSGTTWTLYFNGTSYGTYSGASKTNYATGTAQLGGRNDMDGCGYLSNFRVSTVARYSSNFTPSTAPFTSDASTAMLTCQSNRYIDVSANAQALTASGSVSVQRFNPFGTVNAYSTSVIGGSGYFDGSGDYLQIADSSAFTFGSGDFTVEFWIYSSNTSLTLMIGQNDGNATSSSFDVRYNGTTITGNIFSSGTTYAVAQSMSKNAWHHVALVRNGTSLRIYVDGVSTSSTSVSTVSVNDSSNVLRIGASSETTPGYYFNGYMTDARIVKGTAVYTSNFTPPTAPLTAITNTSLLTSFTNGAIFDNAMMNDLETVGNAQISTSIKKYGTGSLLFDGNDLLLAPTTPNMNFGAGDFTIEAWVYRTTESGTPNNIFQKGITTSSNFQLNLSINASNQLFSYYSTDGSSITAIGTTTTTIPQTTWTHVAVSRSGNTWRYFINGTLETTTTAAVTLFTGTGLVSVGANPEANSGFYGYIDDLRVTKGYARYTATFTPPTAAFPNAGPT